jgi:pimeloyl-ACP methyl ester carboxylesterase
MSRCSLVLVPGLMCDRAVWEPLLPALQPLVDCLPVEHGQADSLVVMARQVLDRAPPRFAIAGHSMGGRVALEVLRLAPERVERVALLDTGYLPRVAGAAGEQEAAKRQALLDLARTRGVRAMALEWVQGMVHPQRLADTALIDDIVAMFERKSADVFARQIRALLERPDGSDVLRAIRVPALVLVGAEDSWSPPAQHRALAALIPSEPTLDVVPDCGHMSPMERPGEVGAALARWLRA